VTITYKAWPYPNQYATIHAFQHVPFTSPLAKLGSPFDFQLLQVVHTYPPAGAEATVGQRGGILLLLGLSFLQMLPSGGGVALDARRSAFWAAVDFDIQTGTEITAKLVSSPPAGAAAVSRDL